MLKIKKETKIEKICFVSLSSYPILSNNNLGYLGGAEIQQIELANELKKNGFIIYFITYGNVNTLTEMKGIHFVSTYDRNNRRNLNSLKKTIIIWKRMKEINSDIYIHRSGTPGIVTIFSLLNHKKTIKMIASNAEVSSQDVIHTDKISKFIEKVLNIVDFKLSDICISQNLYQKTILEKKFNVISLIINNAFNIPPQENTIKEGRFILWIGTLRRIKRPEIFLEIAKKLPDYKFLMIGGKGEDDEFYESIVNEIKNIKNLEFLGFIPHDEIYKYYKKCIILVNTSITEGFPNIFLEAWMNYMPIVSLDIDPDDVIKKYNLGFHSVSMNQMIKDINSLMNDDHLLLQFGENARNYVITNHDIKNVINQYKKLLELLKKKDKRKIKRIITKNF